MRHPPRLVFVGQVTNRNDASATVAQESSNILTLFQMTESLPDPGARLRLRTRIRDAAQAVVRDEWPLAATRVAPDPDPLVSTDALSRQVL